MSLLLYVIASIPVTKMSEKIVKVDRTSFSEERLRLSGRVLDLGLKGRRFESILHLTEVFSEFLSTKKSFGNENF